MKISLRVRKRERIFALGVALIALFGLISCGSDPTATPTTPPTSTPTPVPGAPTATPTPPLSAFDQIVADAKAEVAANDEVYVRLAGLKDQTLIETEKVLEDQFGIKVTLINDPKGFSESTLAFIAEHQNGVKNVPILFHTTVGGVKSVYDAGALADFDFPATFGAVWPKVVDFNNATEVPEYRGGCLAKHWLTYILIYNTNAFSGDTAPTTWHELLEPRFAGKVAAFPTGSPLSYLGLLWGEDAAVRYAKDLFANGVIFSESGSPGISAMVAGGEALASTVNVSFAQQQVDKGAPVGWNLGTDGLFYLAENVCIPKDASHPALAQLIAALWAGAPEDIAGSIRDSEGWTYAYPFAQRGVLLDAMNKNGLTPADFTNVGSAEDIAKEGQIRARIATEAFGQ